MKGVLANWRVFQDAVVRHPLCRYAILPAGIILAVWLAVLALALIHWLWMGIDVYYFVEVLPEPGSRWADAQWWLAVLASAGVAGCLLTGRLAPTLLGLLAVLLAMGAYEEAFLWRFCLGWLALFIPVWLWLIGSDWRAALPVLPRWLKWLAGGLAVGIGMILLARPAGGLLSLAAAFGFTVLFDLGCRVSSDSSTRGSRPLLWMVIALGWLVAYVQLFCMFKS